MTASFVSAFYKRGHGYHHLLVRQSNYFNLAVFKFKNDHFKGDVSFYGLLFLVPLVGKCQRLVCI